MSQFKDLPWYSYGARGILSSLEKLLGMFNKDPELFNNFSAHFLPTYVERDQLPEEIRSAMYALFDHISPCMTSLVRNVPESSKHYPLHVQSLQNRIDALNEAHDMYRGLPFYPNRAIENLLALLIALTQNDGKLLEKMHQRLGRLDGESVDFTQTKLSWYFDQAFVFTDKQKPHLVDECVQQLCEEIDNMLELVRKASFEDKQSLAEDIMDELDSMTNAFAFGPYHEKFPHDKFNSARDELSPIAYP